MLYQFPTTRFVKNTLWRQWWHLLSEVIEVGHAILAGHLQHTAGETWDVKQSAETMHRILASRGADVQSARDTIIRNNEKRSYYVGPAPVPVGGKAAAGAKIKCWNRWCVWCPDGECKAEAVEIDAGGKCWTVKDKE